MNVFPIFPSVVSASILDKRINKYHAALKSEEFTTENSGYDTKNSFSSVSKNILKKYPEVEQIRLQEFYKFKNEVLKYTSTDFKMTTSWMTKTDRGGFCQFHYHRNCYYSGVMYFDDCPSGDLVFKSNLNQSSIRINMPDEWNMLNYQSFFMKPMKNMVVFFPSYLEHKIDLYTDKPTRYSLAFNFHPVGKIGDGDSYIEIKL